MKSLLTFADIEKLQGLYESRSLDIKAIPPNTPKLVELIQSGANGVEQLFRIVLGASEDSNGRFDRRLIRPLEYPLQPDGMGQTFANFDKYRQHLIASMRSHTNEYFEGMFEIREIEVPEGALIVIEVAQSEHRPHQNKQSQRYYIRADGETRPMDDFEVSAEIMKRQQRRMSAIAALAGPLPPSAERQTEIAHPEIALPPIQYHDGLVPGQVIATVSDERGLDQQIRIVGTAHLWMRLEPSTLMKHWTNTQLRDLIGPPAPTLDPLLSYKHSPQWDRNERGAVVWDLDRPGITMSATQIQPHGQIWGIDTRLLEPEHLKERAKTPFAYIPSVGVEKAFEKALFNYLAFAREKLQIPLPYTLAVGISGVQNYRLAVDNDRFEGRMIQPVMGTSIGIQDPALAPSVILLPFFQALWDACGLSRPDDFRTER